MYHELTTESLLRNVAIIKAVYVSETAQPGGQEPVVGYSQEITIGHIGLASSYDIDSTLARNPSYLSKGRRLVACA